MTFALTPLQNNLNEQQTDDIDSSPEANSELQPPVSLIQQSLRIQNPSPYENKALFPLHQIQSQTLPITPIPRWPLELLTSKSSSRLSTSNAPPTLTNTSEKG